MSIQGDRLRKLRKAQHLSQEELAAQAGLDQTLLSDYERSIGNPTAEKLTGLADALNTSTDYLLGRTNDPTPIEDDNPGVLKPKERLVIEKWRRGELAEAAKIILNG